MTLARMFVENFVRGLGQGSSLLLLFPIFYKTVEYLEEQRETSKNESLKKTLMKIGSSNLSG
jgi:hypothetical protein